MGTGTWRQGALSPGPGSWHVSVAVLRWEWSSVAGLAQASPGHVLTEHLGKTSPAAWPLPWLLPPQLVKARLPWALRLCTSCPALSMEESQAVLGSQ